MKTNIIFLLLCSIVSATFAQFRIPSEVESNPARDQLPLWSRDPDKKSSQYAASQSGRNAISLTATQTVGDHGPVTLKDSNFIEQMAHFDRERIPERVAHAKGLGAHGYFEVTHDITQYTKACVFKPGSKTPMLVRFSTVVGERGSADTMHDARGFALKFYTECGNWDLVGNNLEVFPIRDPILFPSLIRSRKRNPVTHLHDQNSWWDFTSLRPESTFHTVQLFSYLGFPDGIRFMDGAGVHTFKLVNANGTAVYCKFHYLSDQGLKNTDMSEAQRLTMYPDYSTEDLYNAIAKGEYPSWKMYVQIMTFKQAEEVSFNPFDITKVWPRDEFPLMPVGRFVLNRNPNNYIHEVEMAAFTPSNMIPGIESSPDRMLHGRLFSYADSQRYRLGSNFLQLRVNQPRNFDSLQTYLYDGACNNAKYYAGPNYFPNSFGGPTVDPTAAEHRDRVMGDVIRKDTGDDDNFSQVTRWYQGRSQEEQQFIANNIAASLRTVHKDIKDRAIENFEQVDPKFANAILAAGNFITPYRPSVYHFVKQSGFPK